MEASFDVGTRILHSMGGINTLQRHDSQQAAFVVLKAPDIPSVLVETAFITTPREEKLLASNAYQNKLARGIRSEERRVGKECVSTCSSRCEPEHSKKNVTTTNTIKKA